MNYREQLRQARQLLNEEIQLLYQELANKEGDLGKIDKLLEEGRSTSEPSLTSQVVKVLYYLSQTGTEGIGAKDVIQEFKRERQDVNSSTIRSTLYQVTKKQRPTEIALEDKTKKVRVLKDGPFYEIELATEKELL